jgi:hypothetical protein
MLSAATRPDKPWYNAELSALRKDRDQKYKFWRTFSGDEQLFAEFKAARNRYDRQLKLNTKAYYSARYSSTGSDARAFWKVTNEVLGKAPKTVSSIDKLIDDDGKRLYKTLDIANELNRYFASIGVKLSKDSVTSELDPRIANLLSCSSTFQIKTPSHAEVYKTLNSLQLNKPAGTDEIPTAVYKLCASPLTSIISFLFINCVKSATFPSRFTASFICPIYKNKGCKAQAVNYRPITIITPIAKCLERIITKQATAYFEDHQLIHPHQYGFRSNRSTQYAISQVIENIATSLNRPTTSRPTLSTLLLDLSKAFDCVNHNLLLEILRRLGFDDCSLKLMTSYLGGRTQRVRIPRNQRSIALGDKLAVVLSDPIRTTTGVPQGSNIGPLLFLVYTSAILNYISNNATVVAFADDTTIITVADNYDSLRTKTEGVLIEARSLMESLGLRLNVAKTTLLIHPPSPLCEKLVVYSPTGNDEITAVNSAKLLGVTITSTLDMRVHISQLICKLKANTATLKSIRNKISLKTSLQLLHTLFYSHHDYCALVWHKKVTSQQQQRLECLHRKFLRLVYNKPYRYSSKQLYKLAMVLPLHERRELNVLRFAHAIMHKTTPRNWVDFLPPTLNPRAVDTLRASGVRSHNNGFFNSIQQSTVRTWNSLPTTIRTQLNPATFKRIASSFLLERFFERKGIG